VTDIVTSVIDTFSDEKLQKLAYVVGSLFGDGCFYRGDGGRIIFSSSDKEYTEIMIKYINETFNICPRLRINKLSLKNKNWKDAYTFTSRPLFKIIKHFSNKATPNFVANGNIKIKAQFIKGFFDAEGNVDIHTIKRRNEIQRHVRCFNNDKDMLIVIQNILKDFKINSCIGKSKGINLCLTIWGYSSLIEFENNISFNINRKKLELRKAIESYKQIQTQWNKETYKAVISLRNCGFGATNIQKELLIKIPKPTIESWIYRDVKIVR